MQTVTGFTDENLKRITLDGDDIEIVEKLSYLGDVLRTEGRVDEAVTSRMSL